MKSLILFCLGTILTGLSCFGQEDYPTRDSTHIFWQPDLVLTKKDYGGKSSKEVEELMVKYDFSASACIGLWSILDVPENEDDRLEKFGKVYFAPAFEIAKSSSKNEDSTQIQIQNLFFDICELSARNARRQLKYYQDTINATGVLTTFYMTVLNDVEERKSLLFSSYFQEVIVEKNDAAYDKWRKVINELLDETKEWATSPEECYRLMTGVPIEKDYIKAPFVTGPLFKDDK